MTHRPIDRAPFRHGLGLLAAAFFTGAFASPAHANLLLTGAPPLPPDIFGFPVNPPTLLASHDSGTTTSTSGALIFDMVSAVYSDPNNAFGAGDLDFMYQVHNLPSSTDSIVRVSAIDFTPFQTDVGYTGAGSGLQGGIFVNGFEVPQFVDRNSADVIGFTFTPAIITGDTSAVLIIETNATNFQAGQVNIIDGGVASVASFEPTPAPEPASGLAMGLLLAGCFRRVRRTR